jgi:hypothetical protein
VKPFPFYELNLLHLQGVAMPGTRRGIRHRIRDPKKGAVANDCGQEPLAAFEEGARMFETIMP